MPYRCFLFFILAGMSACQAGPDPKNMEAFRNTGDSLSRITFDTLRNTLLRAVTEKGWAGAVGFCREEAGGLTGTYALPGIRIRRSSDRVRNKANEPDSLERIWLNRFLEEQRSGKTLSAAVVSDKQGQVHYFKPILAETFCLNCHGKLLEDIRPEVLPVLQTLYPEDRATGYRAGDFRGMWHIQFSENW